MARRTSEVADKTSGHRKEKEDSNPSHAHIERSSRFYLTVLLISHR